MYAAGTFLGALAEPDRTAFLAAVHSREFDRDHVLMLAGEQTGDVAVLLTGRVKLVARGSTGLTVLLGIRGPGDVLGDLSALDERPRAADAIALDDGSAGFITSAALREFVTERSAAALAMIRVLSDRLREADRGRLNLATNNATGRVASCLLELARLSGKTDLTDVRMELPITQEELGSWAGLSRQAVARALEQMRANEWLSSHRQQVVLRNIEALQEQAGI